jgi:hypothetical protein
MVECHVGEVRPHVRCIVPNLETDSRATGRFDNARGTVEQWSKVVPGFPVPGRGRTGPFVGRRVARDGNTPKKRSNGGEWVYTAW